MKVLFYSVIYLNVMIHYRDLCGLLPLGLLVVQWK